MKDDALLLAIEAVDDEEELDGPMPDEVWTEIQAMGRRQMTEYLRATIRVTKRNIKKRILALLTAEPQPPAPANGGDSLKSEP